MHIRQKVSQIGFTLIELVVTMTITSILITMSVIGVRKYYKVANEAVLRGDLFQLNECLNQYIADTGYYPTAIKQLQERGYIRDIPVDPMTKTNNSWIAEFEPIDLDDPEAEAGIFRIRSGSKDIGSNGISYNEW